MSKRFVLRPLPNTPEGWRQWQRARSAARKVLRDPKRSKKAMQASGLDITGKPSEKYYHWLGKEHDEEPQGDELLGRFHPDVLNYWSA